MKGLYLCSPHGSLIWEGEKTAIAIAAPLPLSGHRVICSKEEGHGLAFGIALIGEPALLDVSTFSSREEEHRVSRSCRLKWWPEATHLYHYPILQFQPFPDPVEIEVLPGTTMDMGEVELEVPEVPFLGESDKASAPAPLPAPAGEDRLGSDLALMSSSPNPSLTLPDDKPELVIPADLDTIMSTSLSARKELAMPWKPSDALEHTKKADTPAKQKRWAAVANSALSDCEGETKACEASAIRQANSVIAGMKTLEDEIEQMVTDKVLSTVKMVLGDIETKAGDMGDGAQGKLCTCPNCGFEVEGEADVPCRTQECPKCGAKLQGGDGDDNDSDETPEDSPPPSNDQEDNPNPKDGDEDESDPKDEPKEGNPDGDDESNPFPPKEDESETTEGEPGGELEGDEPTDEDPSGSITAFVMGKLQAVYTALSELFKRETYQEKEPDLSTLYTAKGFKTLGTDKDGNTWFMLWPTNAYKDREGEIFASSALREYVDRHARQYPKGEAWYQHVKGSKFGTIWEQAVVADHFICQLGTYDDSPVGQAFKTFFERYPNGHPKIAPHGWGASHQYDYVWEDRLDGVYEHFNIHESTVLPLEKAANVFNPRPILGGMKMKDDEKTAFATIGSEVGVPDLVDQVTASGQEAKAALDARKVERKSVEEPEPEGTKEEQVAAPVAVEAPPATQKVPGVVANLTAELAKSIEPAPEDEPTPTGQPAPAPDLATQVAETLQLGELSKVLETMTADLKALKDENATLQSTLASLTRADEVKQAEAVQTLPRMSWMRASQAAETIIGDKTVESIKQDARPTQVLPGSVKALAQSMDGSSAT